MGGPEDPRCLGDCAWATTWANVTNQPARDARHRSLHQRLTVALADASDRARLADDLTTALAGGSPDPLAPLRAQDLLDAAGAFAAARAQERAEARARLEAAAGEAAELRDQAAQRLADAAGARDELLRLADWTEQAGRDLPGHRAAVDAARDVLDRRQAELRDAQAGLERVLEQRAAAAAAVEEADRQLSDISGAGMDESGLRRELEVANRSVHEAQRAHEAAQATLAALEAERSQLQDELAALDSAEVIPLVALAPEVIERVLDAFEHLRDAAASAMEDQDAAELAQAWRDLTADLDEAMASAPPPPTPEELAAAEQRAAAAAAELEALEQATTHVLTDEERAEIDAAHAAVLEAEERTARRVGAGGARKRLDAARAVERALLERHGFASHLEVVLSGGRSGTGDATRAEAERAYLTARAELDALRQAHHGSPTIVYLESERERLRGHAVDLLGVDPGDAAVELLEAHLRVPGYLVEELRLALDAVGVHPVGVSLLDAAEAWLVEQGNAADRQAQLDDAAARADAERARLEARAHELDGLLAAAERTLAEAAEGLEMAHRSVDAFEAELTARAGADTQRLKRLAAAEQLRAQVEAVEATLRTAEGAAREALEAATNAHAEAAVAYDEARSVLTQVARDARAAANRLPEGQRPEGDPLATLPELAELLRGLAVDEQPAIDAADAALAEAEVAVADAQRAVDAVADPDAGPQREDLVEGLAQILRDADTDHVLVLDDPFAGIDAGARDELLDLVRAGSADRPLVLLTGDADILGWAIELPADVGTAVPADALLARARREAELDLSEPDRSDHPDTSSTRRKAGRR